MASFYDTEFGDVIVHRSKRSSKITLRVNPTGSLQVSMPPFVPLFVAKRLLESSRHSIREALPATSSLYDKDQDVGKSHRLHIELGAAKKSHIQGQTITVYASDQTVLIRPRKQAEIRELITRVLRKEAKSYLPRRLQFLADQHGFSYSKSRFSHASTRWGSCSSNGTISLNIALMNLPFALIDYVLLHELSHTKEMNHSPRFWQLVGQYDPEYKLHRREIKTYSPNI